MKPLEIKHKLKAKGYTQGMFAEVLCVSPSLISKVISGKAISFKVAEAIAKALSLDLYVVFPALEELGFGRAYKNTNAYQSKKKELQELLLSD